MITTIIVVGEMGGRKRSRGGRTRKGKTRSIMVERKGKR